MLCSPDTRKRARAYLRVSAAAAAAPDNNAGDGISCADERFPGGDMIELVGRYRQ